MDNKIIIFDTTLRDGEQAPGASMTIPEKMRIAQQLARLSVDVIEAGFPISSPAQFQAVEQIASEVKGPVVCGLARATESDVRAAGESLEPGEKTRIHTFIATSDIHIDAKFGDDRFGQTLKEKRDTVLRMATEAVGYARTFTDDVEFSAEDAGRTDVEYLCDIVLAAVEAGATTINVPDTTGYCTPSEYAKLITSVVDCLVEYDDVIISTHCHDDLGLAVANSLAGVRAGARQIECTINGIGERAGNAALEEVVMALTVREDDFGLQSGINAKLLTETSKMVSVYSGFPVQPNKAIVGKNAFSHEAGIHQHGVLRRRDTYEIMKAEDVGQDIEHIRLGRHSGRHGLFSRLQKLGFSIPDDQRDAIYERFVELADRKKEIFDEDLYHLMQVNAVESNKKHYRLDHVEVSIGSGREPEARVRIEHLSTKAYTEEQATGDGPVDALYRAIDHAVGEAHELHSYTIQSVSEGADALGEVTVKVGFGEAEFAGRARHTDVIQASAEAYVDALNHLAVYRTEEEKRFVSNGIMQSFESGAAFEDFHTNT